MAIPIVGLALGAVKGIGKGVKKINEKREANGKGKLLSNVFKGKNKRNAQQQQSQKELEEATSKAKPNALSEELVNPKEEAGKAEGLKKYMPFAIGAGVLMFFMMMMSMISRNK